MSALPKPGLRRNASAVIAALCIAAAAGLHIAGHLLPRFYFELGLPRTGIYLALFTWWGVSVRRRILQTQVRRYLTAAAALMLFWMSVRTAKYFFVTDPDTARRLWYLYYFPMLFIPLLALLVALSLGRPEHYRLPQWTCLFWFAAALLVLLVQTNDLHQFVFTFGSRPWTDRDNGYAFGYWLAIGWDYFCAAAAMAVMLFKCRIPGSRKRIWLPFLPVCAEIVYGLLYLSGAKWLRTVFGDMSLIQCLLSIAALESCIRCGLIRSNTHYRELFRVCAVKAQITDPEYRVLLSSADARSYPAGTMRQTETAPVLFENGTRLSGAPIRGGFVLWEDDVSELMRMTKELEDTREHLQGRNTALAEALKTRRRLHLLAETNRLYNIMQNQTAAQIRRLSELTQALGETDDPAAEKKLLLEIAVLGAYLKRRNNLIFLSERQGGIPAAELSHCLRESLQNLTLFGIPADQSCSLTGELPLVQLMCFYDAFERILEYSLGTLTGLYAALSREEDEAVLSVRLCSRADLSKMKKDGMQILREGGDEWLVTCRAPAGGEEG